MLQLKSTQAILQLLWDVSHLDSLPKHLVERALSEQLNILTDMSLVRYFVLLGHRDKLKPGLNFINVLRTAFMHNFINVLRTAFMHVDPECVKKTFKSAVSFGTFRK